MRSTTIYKIDPLSDPRWASLVQKHGEASVFHTPGWLTALRQTYNYLPVVFTTSPPDTDLTNGVLFCPVRSWITGNRLVSLPFSDHCSPLVNNSEELQSILDFLRQDLAGTSGDTLKSGPEKCHRHLSIILRPTKAIIFTRCPSVQLG